MIINSKLAQLTQVWLTPLKCKGGVGMWENRYHVSEWRTTAAGRENCLTIIVCKVKQN